MNKLGKALLVGGSSVVFGLCSSCAVPSGGVPETKPMESSTPHNGLESVDVCSILTPVDLQELGLEGPGELVGDGSPEPACDYAGDAFGAMIAKNPSKSVESYANEPSWANFDRVSVAGRVGAQGIQKDAVGADLYDTLFDAGGGVIVVTVSEFRPGTVDERAESLKLAERIAPRLPR